MRYAHGVGKPLEPFYGELGRRVAQLRHDRGLSQQALGEAMKPRMTRASVANIENGKQRVLAHTFVELAEILRCELDVLAGRRDALPAADAQVVQRELEQKLKTAPRDVVERLTERLGLVAQRKTTR